MSEVTDKPAAKTARILNPQRMGLAEQLRQDWVVNAEEGTSVEEVLDPQYWAHMAMHLQPMDRIDVRAETGDWLLELLVINTGRNWAQMHLLARHDLVKRAETMPASVKHRVEWKGPQLRWCVIRNGDNEMLQKGMEKQAAIDWLSGYEKTTG
jgi:hypothetical protein